MASLNLILWETAKLFSWEVTLFCILLDSDWASQVALVVKNTRANAGNIRDMGSIPGLGRSPEGRGGHGNPLQCSCLEYSMDTGAWQASVHRVAKRRTWLKQLCTHGSNWEFYCSSFLSVLCVVVIYHPLGVGCISLQSIFCVCLGKGSVTPSDSYGLWTWRWRIIKLWA